MIILELFLLGINVSHVTDFGGVSVSESVNLQGQEQKLEGWTFRKFV